VGLIPYPYPFKINGREVAEILMVPFNFLADTKNWYQNSSTMNNPPFDDFFVPYVKHLIWGATARILKNFFERVEPERAATQSYRSGDLYDYVEL
jgi:hypothetical protein